MGHTLSDKDIHCIARHIQMIFSNNTVASCLYCKYAIECTNEFKATGRHYFIDDLTIALKEKTGVDIRGHLPENETFLAGSWMEEDSATLAAFSNMSLEEQLRTLQSEDIQPYAGNRLK